eukprot:2423680-Rhodomonas_salina.1
MPGTDVAYGTTSWSFFGPGLPYVRSGRGSELRRLDCGTDATVLAKRCAVGSQYGLRYFHRDSGAICYAFPTRCPVLTPALPAWTRAPIG